ncbi:MAG TPA: bifunctional adenosylcobinamide kinase/adenosylcobinamide-phosphate guanylyltransferase [Acidimicrobiales bacterium]|nr:bifunctional adenosylcobinamide kinase/adenosylcobinamide-phosphate guanylyltransferase [Acidimicrobiales bacterium]
MITLVLGGARSGKSEVAERLAARLGPAVTYVATATVTDEEMAERIEAHRRRRPPQWSTVESEADLAGLVRALEGPVLVDGLGVWLARQAGFRADGDELAQALSQRDHPAVVVSDEVGLGVHPSTEAGRHFRDALGLLNRSVAAVADEVLLVVAGRVLRLDAVG